MKLNAFDEVCMDSDSENCGFTRRIAVEFAKDLFQKSEYNEEGFVFPISSLDISTCAQSPSPTSAPTLDPTYYPTRYQTIHPSLHPTYYPTKSPSKGAESEIISNTGIVDETTKD